MKKWKISIIIPTYNVQEYIAKCLKSIINQTFRNIEIIVVDDYSSDDTVRIITKFAVDDKRIKFIKLLENSSALIARKVGVEAATGDYIMFVDPDDELYLNACEIALKNIVAKNVDILGYGTDVRNCGNAEPNILKWHIEFFEQSNNYLYGEDILKQCFEKKVIIWNIWNKIFKVSLCKEAFTYIPNQKIYRYNDFFAFFLLAWHAKSYFGISEKLYHYNFGIGSYAKSKMFDMIRFDRMVVSLSMVLKGLREFLVAKNDYDRWKTILDKFEADFLAESYNELLNISDFTDGSECVGRVIDGYDKKKVNTLFFSKFIMLKKLQADYDALATEHSSLQEEHSSLQEEHSSLQAYIAMLVNTKSYKIGRLITYLPRKCLSFFKKEQREKDIGNLVEKVLWKIAPDRMALKDLEREHALSLSNFKEKASFSEEKWREELHRYYYDATGYDLHLENPKLFTEKIQWRKYYDRDPVYSQLTDKYLVRDWVAKKIGEEHLIPLLGVWHNAREINFQKLPNQFVLKTNHASATNIIVKDKSKLKIPFVREQLNYWLKMPFWCCSGEMHYKLIKPCIIAEKYMEPEIDKTDLIDYKFHCFKREPLFCEIIVNRSSSSKQVAVYDMQWQRQNWQLAEKEPTLYLDKPAQYKEMIDYATILCHGFEYVRVDFYVVSGMVYFGELTFTDGSGLYKTYPRSADMEIGKLWDIEVKQVDKKRL